MKENTYGTWQEIAWNGICLNAPTEWRPGTIGKSYLLFEDDSGPVMEIKWSRIKANFSHKKQFSRIESTHKKSIKKILTEDKISPVWKNAIKRYQATFFSWVGENINGKGLILYCPYCRKATLIQFYLTKRLEEGLLVKVLSSFRDHDTNGYLTFNIFDVKAKVPDKFKLIRHRFEPGLFELEFKSKENMITLYSWGPASFLLKRKNLQQFAETIFHINNKDFDRIDPNNSIVEWSLKPSHLSLDRILGLLKIKPVFQRFRIKHIEEKNRIYGIHVKGKKLFSNTFFNRICEAYEKE